MDYGADAYRRFLLDDDYGLEQVIGLYKDSLPKNQREMVYLVYFEDMNIAQAASVIGKTQRQGTNILFRARQRLKSILQEEGFEYENKS